MLLEERKKKMDALKEMGVPLYPAGYRCDLTISEVLQRFGQMDHESLEKTRETFSLAGRIMALRDFGKASFVQIKDRTGRIQAYIRKDKVGEEDFRVFKLMDVGDFIGIKGSFFRTKTGNSPFLLTTSASCQNL